MSSTQHTPGPWKVFDYGDAITVATQDGHQRIADNLEVALLRAEALANAHLIAAAPDQHSALQIALKIIEAENLDEKYDGEAEVIRAAIALAQP